MESFNGKLRDELLAREQFDTLREAKVLIERWRMVDNTGRPPSSLGYRAPAPEAIQPASLELQGSLKKWVVYRKCACDSSFALLRRSDSVHLRLVDWGLRVRL